MKVKQPIKIANVLLAILATLLVVLILGLPKKSSKRPRDPFRLPDEGFQQLLPETETSMDAYTDALADEDAERNNKPRKSGKKSSKKKNRGGN